MNFPSADVFVKRRKRLRERDLNNTKDIDVSNTLDYIRVVAVTENGERYHLILASPDLTLLAASYDSSAHTICSTVFPGLHFFFGPSLLRSLGTGILAMQMRSNLTPADQLTENATRNWLPCPVHGPFGCSCHIFTRLVEHVEKLCDEILFFHDGTTRWRVVEEGKECSSLNYEIPFFYVSTTTRSWWLYVVGISTPKKVVGPFPFFPSEKDAKSLINAWKRCISFEPGEKVMKSCVRCGLAPDGQRCEKCRSFICSNCRVTCSMCSSLVCHACCFELREGGPMCLWCT